MVRKNRRTAGFTFVELLIVISLLAALAILAVMSFLPQIGKGNDAKRKSDIDRIKVAVEEYEKDHNCYPLPDIMNCTPGTGLQPYLNKIPCDPTTGSPYLYTTDNNTCPTWYKLYAVLQNKSDPEAIPNIGPNAVYNYVSGSANAPTDTSQSSVPVASPASGIPVNYYGCKNGVCTSLPGPICSPNYTDSSCFGRCGTSSVPQNECN
jgi:general secretion pathway protein G